MPHKTNTGVCFQEVLVFHSLRCEDEMQIWVKFFHATKTYSQHEGFQLISKLAIYIYIGANAYLCKGVPLTAHLKLPLKARTAIEVAQSLFLIE